MKQFLCLLFTCSFFVGNSQSIYIENEIDPDVMIMDFFDSDSLDITNVTFAGADIAMGFFDADTLLDISAGLVFSTGDIFKLPFPASDFAASNNNDPDYIFDEDIFTAIGGQANNYDPVSIEFDLVSQATKELTFNYIFGSEEYPEFVNSSFNDAFLFLVSGPGIEGQYSNNSKNIAMIPGTNDPVAINNLNEMLNSEYYIDNAEGQYLILDAHTTKMPASFEALANETYHIKIVIADVSDATFDSGIFLGYNSLGNMDSLVPPTIFSLLQNGNEISIENESKYAVEYTWDFGDGQTSTDKHPSNINFMTPGDYEVTLSAKNYCCTNTFTTVVNVPANALTISTNIQQHVLCHGENSGIINVIATGGNGPYTYASEPAADFGVMPAGEYVIIVTDQDGQTAMQEITITQPDPITVSSIIWPATDNQATGSIEAIPSGGTEPYEYVWSNNETSQIIENLVPGDYSVTITDTNGCFITSTYTVDNLFSSLQANANIIQHVSCYLGNDGHINFDISGGNPPYSFATNPEITDFQALFAGEYSFVITDQDGQAVDGLFTILEPADLELETTTIASDEGMDNGSASVDVNGGTAPYTYLWSTSATTPEITGLAPGDYSVEVTDANDCVKFEDVTVEMLVSIDEIELINLEIYPNPSSDIIVLKNITSSIESLFFTNIEGRKIDMKGFVSSTNQVDISSLSSGIYIIEIQDSNDQFYSGEVVKIK